MRCKTTTHENIYKLLLIPVNHGPQKRPSQEEPLAVFPDVTGYKYATLW